MVLQAFASRFAETLLKASLPGGVVDPDIGRLVGQSWELGKETNQEFFRRLAALMASFLEEPMGIPGHGDRDRLEFETVLSSVLEDMLMSVASAAGEPWEQWWQQATTPSGGSTALDPDELRDRIVQYLDMATVLQAMSESMQISDEEQLTRQLPDEDENEQKLYAEWAVVGSTLPKSVLDALMAGPKWAKAGEIIAQRPVNAVTPTRWDGIAVHKVIQADYVAKRPGSWVVMERSVFGPGGSKFGTISEILQGGVSGLTKGIGRDLENLEFSTIVGLTARLRPDICDFRPPTGQVYEIKPRAGARWALAQVEGYCYWYNNLARDPGTTVLKTGNTYVPPRIFLAGKDKLAHTFVVPELPGLLLYDLYKVDGRKWRGLFEQHFSFASTPESVANLVMLSGMAVLLLVLAAATTFTGAVALASAGWAGLSMVIGWLIGGGILAAA